MPFHLLHSSHYYEPSSPQQPPLIQLSVLFIGNKIYVQLAHIYFLSLSECSDLFVLSLQLQGTGCSETVVMRLLSQSLTAEGPQVTFL